MLNLSQIEAAITGTQFATDLIHLPTTPSTNTLALEAAQSGIRHGVWIADEQTAGRGRGNHAWHSSPGDGIYLSALITPPIPMQSSLQLSLRTALAVQSAIASVTGFRIPDEIDIRWPNDLLLHGRKCGGILIETAAQPAPASGTTMLRHAVIGIGVNCNHTHFPPEIDALATSLRRELPQATEPLPREPLIAAILVALDQEIRLLIRRWRGTDHTRSRKLTEYSTWIEGKRVQIEDRPGDPGGYTGTTAGLNPEGFLLVNGDDGCQHTVLSGGVRAL